MVRLSFIALLACFLMSHSIFAAGSEDTALKKIGIHPVDITVSPSKEASPKLEGQEKKSLNQGDKYFKVLKDIGIGAFSLLGARYILFSGVAEDLNKEVQPIKNRIFVAAMFSCLVYTTYRSCTHSLSSLSTAISESLSGAKK